MLREIAENLADPVFLVDKAFNVWYHNRAFEMAVGVRMSSRRYQGMLCHQLLNLEICANNCVMKRAVESRQNVRLAEIAGTTITGDHKNFHIHAVPVVNASGAAFGSLIFLRDITAETRIHQKYKELVARNSAISLSGLIEGGNLVDVVQLFVFLQKTGSLTLHQGKQTGEILFDRGQMVSLACGTAKAEKALGRLLEWQQGSFSFRPLAAAESAERLTKSADFLLMDAVREKDELAARAGELPGREVKPQVARQVTREEAGVDDVAWQLYELAQGQTSVADMLERVTQADARVYLGLLALRDKGLLTW